MQISLREFQSTDLEAYESWRREIGAQRYMSHFYPRAFDGRNVGDSNLYAWYVIVVDGADVGTIWLEKNDSQERMVTLGILIGDKEKLGIGIGRKAIPLAIRQARQTLGFETVCLHVRKANTRAIACYQHCGFSIVKEGRKVRPDGEVIAFYEMCLALAEPSPHAE